MCKILGDVLLGHAGFILMIVVAFTVVIAVFGTTLACMNTGVRVTYAMAQDGEVPSMLNVLHHKHATPHTAVLVMAIVSAAIGAYGVLSLTGLTAITLLSNFGTFLLYGMTNLIALVAFLRSPERNIFTHVLVPILGCLANVGMLLAIIYMGILGGGMTQVASMIAIVATAIWVIVGIIYFVINSRATGREIVSGYKTNPV
jgi:amino acid transporter